MLAKLTRVTRDCKHPLIETRKQHGLLFQRRADLHQQVYEPALVIQRIRTAPGNRRVARVQSVTVLVAIEPNDRHTSPPERAGDCESCDVTVKYQRRRQIERIDLLAHGCDEFAWIVDHVRAMFA